MTKEAVIFLFIAIVVEVIATISLKLSDSFTRLVPSLVTIIGYCIAFWCLMWGGNHFCTDRRRYEFIVKSTMARPAGEFGDFALRGEK